MIAFALLAALAGAQPAEAPFEGEPTLEVCLTQPGAGRHSACAPVLQAEVALAPDGLFNTANETPPARLEGWLGAVCAPDRLASGQTAEACMADAEARLERSRAARRALTQTDGRSGSRYGSLRASAEAEIARREALGETVPEAPAPAAASADEERCRRDGGAWRDEDSGDSEASYSIRCSWGSRDPETRRRAEEALDAVMGRD